MELRTDGAGSVIVASVAKDWRTALDSALARAARFLMRLWLRGSDSRRMRQRLLARGRETAEEVEQRLARSARLQAAADPSVHVLDNSSTLEAAVAAFFSLLRNQGVLPRG